MTDDHRDIYINTHSPGALEVAEFQQKQAALHQEALKTKTKKQNNNDSTKSDTNVEGRRN
ncbi:MAG: hypothetical protein ACYCX4_07930 [Bacillota bacterium]